MTEQLVAHRPIYMSTCPNLPGMYWLAHTLKDVMDAAGVQQWTGAPQCSVKTIPAIDPLYTVAAQWLHVVGYMQHVDPNGEYDTLPMSADNAALLLSIVDRWTLEQDLPFTSPNQGLLQATHLLQAIRRNMP